MVLGLWCCSVGLLVFGLGERIEVECTGLVERGHRVVDVVVPECWVVEERQWFGFGWTYVEAKSLGLDSALGWSLVVERTVILAVEPRALAAAAGELEEAEETHTGHPQDFESENCTVAERVMQSAGSH